MTDQQADLYRALRRAGYQPIASKAALYVRGDATTVEILPAGEMMQAIPGCRRCVLPSAPGAVVAQVRAWLGGAL